MLVGSSKIKPLVLHRLSQKRLFGGAPGGEVAVISQTVLDVPHRDMPKQMRVVLADFSSADRRILLDNPLEAEQPGQSEGTGMTGALLPLGDGHEGKVNHFPLYPLDASLGPLELLGNGVAALSAGEPGDGEGFLVWAQVLPGHLDKHASFNQLFSNLTRLSRSKFRCNVTHCKPVAKLSHCNQPEMRGNKLDGAPANRKSMHRVDDRQPVQISTAQNGQRHSKRCHLKCRRDIK